MTSTTHTAAVAQADRARAFHTMHTDGVLVLPNVWDAASAVLVRDAGARPIATTSAGASWSFGVPDGEQLDRHLAVDLIARITSLVEEPVTADLEAGYGADPGQVALTAQAVLAAGAVGVNVEDAVGPLLRDRHEQAERIAAVRSAASSAEVPLFINARTDTYLLPGGDAADRLRETIRRAETYLAAGADGIFVPGLMDVDSIRSFVAAVPAPLNVMVGPGALTISQLADLGVRRVSTGMAIAQAAYATTRRAAVELLTLGTYGALDGGLNYAAMNTALTRRPSFQELRGVTSPDS